MQQLLGGKMTKFRLFQQLKSAIPNEQCVVARVGECFANSAQEAIKEAKGLPVFRSAYGLARFPIVQAEPA